MVVLLKTGKIQLSQSVSDVEKDFVYRTGKIGKQWGLGEPTGKIWATLLFAKKPVTQKEIAEKTGYSLSLISPTLKILVNLDMARIQKGNNKENTYELTSTLNDAFSGMMKRFLERDVKPLVAKLEDISGAYPDNKNVKRSLDEYVKLESSIGILCKVLVADRAKLDKIEKILD